MLNVVNQGSLILQNIGLHGMIVIQVYADSASAILNSYHNKVSVTVIPWAVRMYVNIIHSLQLVDYLRYRWTNMDLLLYSTYISVDIAKHELFRAKVGKGG